MKELSGFFKSFKKFLSKVFIDGLSGMALGLFATLIVGTIIQQIGQLIPGSIGELIFLVGKTAAALTGAGIGVGVAVKFKKSALVTLSAATAGMVGAFASKILSGALLSEGAVVFAGPGEPLGAFIAAYFGMEIGSLVSGKTKVDILVTPLVTIAAGSALGLLVGPPISSFMTSLGALINWGTEQQPLLMGIIVSVIMGVCLTLPISSAALGIILNLSGIAAGAATIGCCCNMVGFAVASYRENKVGGLLAQGIGTSMLQMPNIVKKPIIWLPAVISSAILGPIGILVFNMQCNATGSGMGTAGLVGQIMTWQVMTEFDQWWLVLIKIAVMHFILPAALSLGISEFMRKRGWIKQGDMKLDY
ncbi:MAG: PTS sugar transporter subunit IIC [Clostridia bacterium]|nr:PTS sugar transporter subunit IIC [Clostridia bacterium]